ncbi:MAG: glycosyltransferase family 9 protein [Candidatus Gastranaerophilaceae bacterium]
MKYYKELALCILENYDCNILIAGSKEDMEKVKVFENLHPNIKIIAGNYSIMESAAVFSLADVFVSGDTGPLHIASAVSKPFCIGLYGAAPPGRTGPWGINHFAVSADLSCIPCNKRNCLISEYSSTDINPCMSAIKPEHVLRVIIDNDLLV